MKEAGISKTALVLVGRVLGHEGFTESRLYAADFSTEFRSAK
jgi:precorrin-4/cobalt-precorrin-4 C11-methyltransferase